MFSVSGKRPETNRYIINGVDWIGGNAPSSFITPLGFSRQLLGVEAVTPRKRSGSLSPATNGWAWIATAGQITGAATQRELQIALKFNF